VLGSLVSAGTQDAPVTFTSAAAVDDDDESPTTPVRGDWGNLHFLGSEGGSLTFTTVSYGNKVLAEQYALPISDTTIEHMQGFAPHGVSDRSGLDYQDVPGPANVTLTRLSYDGTEDDDPDSDTDTGVTIANYGGTEGLNGNTAGFAVTVLDSVISGRYPLTIEHDSVDTDGVVDLTLTGNDITDTGGSTALFAGTFSTVSEQVDAAGSARLTGTVADNTIRSARGEGMYLEAEADRSAAAADASAAGCAAGTFGACNDVALTDNAVEALGSAVRTYAWAEDGSGDAVVANVVQGGSYTAYGDGGWIAGLDAETGSQTGTSRTVPTLTDVELFAGSNSWMSSGGFAGAYPDEGDGVSSPVLTDVDANGAGYGWYSEAYGEGADGTATTSTVLDRSRLDSGDTGLYSYAESAAGPATAAPELRNGSRIDAEEYGLLNEAYASDDEQGAGAATATPTVVDSAIDSDDAPALYNEAYADSGDSPADGSFTLTRAQLSAYSAYGVESYAYPSGTGTGTLDPVVEQSSVDAGAGEDGVGVYLYVDTDEGPGEVGGSITGSSISSYDETFYVELDSTGGNVLDTRISGSDLFSEDDDAVYLDVDDDLRESDEDADGTTDTAVTAGTAVVPTLTGTCLTSLDGYSLYACASSPEP